MVLGDMRKKPEAELRIPRKARPFISKHIRKHIKVYKMPREQAIAVALHEARTKGFKIPKVPISKLKRIF